MQCFHRPSILIIDPDEPTRELIAELLTDAGYHVRPAPDDIAAFAYLAQEQFDVIVLDYAPQPEGKRAVLARLRHDGGPMPPVLALSTTAREEACLRAGASAFLRKPFDIDVFVATVDGCRT